MFLNRGACAFRFTLWSLLSLWVFFGCLELIDESHIIPSLTEDASAGEDVDEAALAQLASGLKSDLLSFGTPHSVSALRVITQSVVTSAEKNVHPYPRLARHGHPTVPIYQRLSVYRI